VSVSLASAWAFALLLMRTGGLVLTAPILSARFVPARVRLGLALAVTVAAYAGAGSPRLEPPAGLAALASAAAIETALGALAGLAAR
jgi:flagellar biosynthetic protein FliR